MSKRLLEPGDAAAIGGLAVPRMCDRRWVKGVGCSPLAALRFNNCTPPDGWRRSIRRRDN
jgi:hypothetical protein